MKVEKHAKGFDGKPYGDLGELDFSCEYCGCEFVANHEEYQVRKSGRIIKERLFRPDIAQPIWLAEAKCPECNSWCSTNGGDIDEPPYEVYIDSGF